MTASIWWVEEAFSVPVVMNFADTPFDIAEVALIAENNPFPMVARIYPQRPVTAIGFNIRLEMSTPVRAAVMDGDGVWHVVSEEVLVMTPGGCSAPGGGSRPRPARRRATSCSVTMPAIWRFSPRTMTQDVFASPNRRSI